MFTGIVKGLGTVIAIEDREAFRILKIAVGDLVDHPQVGGSVAVNGVCLTITASDASGLSFEVMAETLKKSTLAGLRVGDRVNIETPLRVGDELGGHIVQGHVDGTTEILEREQSGENTRVRFAVSAGLRPYLLEKGSVALDGISLTVCDLTNTHFDVWLLPLTLERTTLGLKPVGESANVEVDYLVKAFLSRT